MADLNKIIDELSKLTVVEAADLSKKLEEKWGVTAATAVAAAPAGAGAAPAEQKDEFTIFLASSGDLKSGSLTISIRGTPALLTSNRLYPFPRSPMP